MINQLNKICLLGSTACAGLEMRQGHGADGFKRQIIPEFYDMITEKV